MKVVRKYPPNIKDIAEVFPDAKKRDDVIFTYGNKLHNPNGVILEEDLMVHEQTHSKQQGDDPKKWWDRYFIDERFRLEQEVEAYHNQFKYALENYGRQRAREILRRASKELSSALYGNIIREYEAKERIKHG